MTEVLSINQLTKYYGTLCALNQVSFKVPEKSIFGILGPNGSGKTTLLGSLTDVFIPTSGIYQWFGETSHYTQRKHIGTLLETPHFYPYLSAYDNLCINATIKGCPKKDVDRVLTISGLSDRAGSLFRTFSLGMKQRLALASVMLGNPSVIVLDEPTNGLDPTGIAEIRKLIIQMGQQGKTIIMASHLLDEVEKVCTHVVILKKGKLLSEGPVNEVLSGNAVIEIASEDLELLQKTIMAFPGLKSINQVNHTLRLSVEESVRDEDINRFCFANGITLHLLRRVKESLENKFIELTEGNL
ncbi:MAG: ABC transporter ATP-binding protein [Chitinophagaceae bacterium]